ncbi:MAG: aminopeptidase P family protein [Planctomycetes bacterium]|nr:aminopeptidase P family protein [Planctomycetota bacterium]MCB9905012.1 aminopeptidase P family protein [Planctomycetota bacterium]
MHAILTSLFLLVAPQEPAHVPPTPPLNIRCGLGADFHAGRRAALGEKLGNEGVLVLRGMHETRDYTRFHQDKTFWYLTGVESPDAAFAMDFETGRQVLFLPPHDERYEVWNGERWDAGDRWVTPLTGVDEIRSVDDMEAVLDEMIDDGDRVWISYHPWVTLSGGYDRAQPADNAQARDPFDGRPNREKQLKTKLEERYGAAVKNCAREIIELRLVKTEEELDALRRASVAGALAMNEAVRSTRSGLGEWELDSLMAWVQRRNGAAGSAYHPIVGSGANSLTLHYQANDRRMQDGDILLIDYGPEIDHYVTDITRTWPVNGNFTDRQAELYDAVLAAQLAGIEAAKPGATIGSVTGAANGVLVERGFSSLIRHGVCHWVGMEVHDPGDYATVLSPGMVFTIEPGLYEPATDIGIRIEDVVVITEDGCEVITSDAPKSREDMERLVAEEGILDVLDGEDPAAER